MVMARSPVIHGGVEMIGRVEMRAVMSHEPDPFDGPALAIGQILLLEAGKEARDVGGGVLVRQILDARAIARRVRRDLVLERHRNVDQAPCHIPLRFASAEA
jgi:hypothetical protein